MKNNEKKGRLVVLLARGFLLFTATLLALTVCVFQISELYYDHLSRIPDYDNLRQNADLNAGNYEKVSIEKYLGKGGAFAVLNEDGTFFHSELNVKGEPFCSVVEAKEPAAGYNPVELGYTFDTREALERAFALLAEGGRVDLPLCELPWSPWAAQVTDRFGVRWFLTLMQHRPPEDFKLSI